MQQTAISCCPVHLACRTAGEGWVADKRAKGQAFCRMSCDLFLCRQHTQLQRTPSELVLLLLIQAALHLSTGCAPAIRWSMSASAALLSAPDSRAVLLLMVSHSSLVASSMSAASVCRGPDSGSSEALLGLAALLASDTFSGCGLAESEYCLQAGAVAFRLACSNLQVALLRDGDLCRACLKLSGTQLGWSMCKHAGSILQQ